MGHQEAFVLPRGKPACVCHVAKTATRPCMGSFSRKMGEAIPSRMKPFSSEKYISKYRHDNVICRPYRAILVFTLYLSGAPGLSRDSNPFVLSNLRLLINALPVSLNNNSTIILTFLIVSIAMPTTTPWGLPCSSGYTFGAKCIIFMKLISKCMAAGMRWRSP